MASSESRLRLSAALLLALAACASRTGALRAEGPAWQHVTLVPTVGERATAGELVHSAEATVFVFWSSGCPCVRRYQARVDALAAGWAARGVNVVQVSSNAGESLEALREAVVARGLPLPVWRDEGGRLARALGARSTPTVALVRRDGQLLYRGWIDNEREPGEPDREPWLELALSDFAVGKQGTTASPTWGCTITRSLASRETAVCHPPPDSPTSSTHTGGTP